MKVKFLKDCLKHSGFESNAQADAFIAFRFELVRHKSKKKRKKKKKKEKKTHAAWAF